VNRVRVFAMPLLSSHVFASHIGHTGKTTLTFQMSCLYAQTWPNVSVLVMDLAEEGDLTKRMLGGVDGFKEKEEALAGGVFRLLGDADTPQRRSLTSWVFGSSATSDLDITAHAVNVNSHNGNVPRNVYLLSSGAWPRSEGEYGFPSDKRKELCKKILDSLEKSERTWKLFCDTDGDRRPSPFTMLGYGLCSQAIVPLHLNKGDLDRTETMLGMLADLRQKGEVTTQVLMVVWNMVTSRKEEVEGDAAKRGLNFTPTKICMDILDACNERLWACAKDSDMPGLFVHGSAVSKDEFVRASTYVFRQLADNVQKPAEELGMPFAEMVRQIDERGTTKMKLATGGVVYEADAKTIHNVDEAMRGLERTFEAMTIDADVDIGTSVGSASSG